MAGHHRELSLLTRNRCLLDGAVCAVLLALIWTALLRPADDAEVLAARPAPISSYQDQAATLLTEASRASFSDPQTAVQVPPGLAAGASAAPGTRSAPGSVVAPTRQAAPPTTPPSVGQPHLPLPLPVCASALDLGVGLIGQLTG